MKTCFKCKTKKPMSEFYKHPKMADGHVGKCKECNRLDVVTNRARKLDYYQAYDRARASLPHRVVARMENAARYKVKFFKHRKARIMVGNAIKAGRLMKQPCAVCGEPKTDAHHADYNKPLDVTWLCVKHHHEKHRKYNYAELLRKTA